MIKQHIAKYLHNDNQIMIIALHCAIIGGFVLLYFVLYSPVNKALIAMVTGLLLTSMMLSSTYLKHNSIQRLYFGGLTTALSGVAFFLGSLSGNSLLLSSLGMIVFLPFVGMSNPRHILLSSLTFFFFNAYILGFGMKGDFSQALDYGVYYAIGGILIVCGGFIRVYIRAAYMDIHEQIPFVLNTKFFCRENALHSLILVLCVLLCNYIAFRLKLARGYWLPMTAFLLIKNEHSVSISRAVHRFTGTLLGGFLSFLLCLLITNKLFLALLTIPLLYFTIVAIARHYGSFTFFLTICISCLLNIMVPSGVGVVIERLVNTFAGVLIVIIVLQIFRWVITYINSRRLM